MAKKQTAGLYPQLKSHLAIEVPGEGRKTEWCEAVTDDAYCKLP